MEFLLIILIAGILGSLVLFFVETWMLSKYNETYKEWIEAVDTYIEAYEAAKAAVNANANTLRAVQETVNDHDRIMRVMSIVVDLHSEALKIGIPDLRHKLEDSPHTESVVALTED